MLGEHVTMNQALVVTVFSMAIVFLTLLVISFILDIFKITIHDKKDKNQKEVKTKAVIQETSVTKQDDEELVAVITAAIAASIGKKSDNLIIKNIKRIPDTQSAWTKTGRIELMR